MMMDSKLIEQARSSSNEQPVWNETAINQTVDLYPPPNAVASKWTSTKTQRQNPWNVKRTVSSSMAKSASPAKNVGR